MFYNLLRPTSVIFFLSEAKIEIFFTGKLFFTKNITTYLSLLGTKPTTRNSENCVEVLEII